MNKKAFTLLEMLITLMLVSLIFSLILILLKAVGVEGVIWGKKSEKLFRQIDTFFQLKHQLEGLSSPLKFEIQKKQKKLIFSSTQGISFRGLVDVCYVYEDGILYYSEKVSGLKKKNFCRNDLTPIGGFGNFSVKVFVRGKWIKGSFLESPEKVIIKLGTFEVFVTPKIGKSL